MIVPENQTDAIILEATDADGSDLDYSISRTNASLFNCTSKGVVTFKNAPDYEKDKHTYTFRAIVTDGDHNATQDITINITDKNDETPVFTGSNSANAEENQRNAITLVATDADAGDVLTYSISGGADAGSFNIIGAVVAFKNSEIPNYESGKISYSFIAKVTDKKNHSSTRNVTINITDKNDETPVFIGLNSANVEENQRNVIRLTATDADTGNTLVYSISGTDASLFTCTNAGIVTFNTAPDYEQKKHRYSFVATVTDGDHNAIQNVTITLLNETDVKPTLQNFTASIEDNTASGTTLTKTIDFDAGDSNITLFTLSDTRNFSIANNGVVRTKSTFNAKLKSLYALTLVASSASGDSDSVRFDITILLNTKDKAMDKITAYADDKNQPAPTVQDYKNAGVTGVNATNLNAVNEKIDAKDAIGVNTLAKIQTIVNNDPLPTGMTIDKDVIIAYIASMNYGNDDTKDTQGKIDGNGFIVKVPYTATRDVTLLAYTSNSLTITTAHTQDNDAGITATLQWDTQNIHTGSGRFNAKIIIDDSSATTPDNIYLAKKLNIGENELTVANFKYERSDNGLILGRLTLKIIPGVLDRNFNVRRNGKYEHRFMYIPVRNPTTRKIWLNNNLGAEYADLNSPNFNPKQQATARDDHKAYGSLFQWGRKADGHELVKSRSGVGGVSKYSGTTVEKSNDPDHSLFIRDGVDQADWRLSSNDTLWANEASANNVCPKGYRLPTAGASGQNKEWEEEVGSWDPNIQADAAALGSPLKLTLAGLRGSNDGKIFRGEGTVSIGLRIVIVIGLAITLTTCFSTGVPVLLTLMAVT
jgi:hypothetical protein